MKTHPFLLVVLLGASGLPFTGCASRKPASPAPAVAVAGKEKPDGKAVQAADDLDEYSAAAVSDPFEPVNRVTFWVNHQLYTYLLRPISKTYETITPKFVRTGVYNAFENVKYPVRLVNDGLQGKFQTAGLETAKFLLNTTVGLGGLGRPSDHVPALADVPAPDTAQTFAKWGIGSGPYIVLPILGPSTLRGTAGLAGDWALNPITWVSFFYGGYTWFIAIPASNTVRTLPVQLGVYDTATKNALDRYLAARSAYVQYRAGIDKR